MPMPWPQPCPVITSVLAAELVSSAGGAAIVVAGLVVVAAVVVVVAAVVVEVFVDEVVVVQFVVVRAVDVAATVVVVNAVVVVSPVVPTPVVVSPVVAGGLLYVDGSGGISVYLPTTGREVAKLPLGDVHWQSPIVADGRVATGEGNANDITYLPGREGKGTQGILCATAIKLGEGDEEMRRSQIVLMHPPGLHEGKAKHFL